jgi:signal transduction histidine kinase/ligand-binding sensor domain-containing protein
MTYFIPVPMARTTAEASLQGVARCTSAAIALLLLTVPAEQITQAQTAGDDREIGRPFVSCYTPKDYGGYSIQNWSFAQDNDGVLYVGNGDGVLVFDGSSWGLIENEMQSDVRWLARDENGRIYVSGTGEFGYLAPDEVGQMRYVSLLPFVDESLRDFQDVWTIHATPGGIFFQSRDRVFRFRPGQSNGEGEHWEVDSWDPEGRFLFAFWIDETYYVHQGEVGLMRLVGDSLKVIPGSERFANERLQVMLPLLSESGGSVEGKILLGLFNSGLFVFDGATFEPYRSEIDELLKENTLYKGLVLPGGRYGFATLNAGFLVTDRQGKLRLRLDVESGLGSNNVLSMYLDRHGSLWLGPESGICRVETSSRLTRFDATRGLLGGTNDVLRHNGTLYVATGAGLYFLDGRESVFRPVAGVVAGNPQSWDLAEVEGDLLAATGTGIYRVDGTRAELIRLNAGGDYLPWALRQSKQSRDHVFVGLSTGLGLLRRNPSGQWVDDGLIVESLDDVVSVVEDSPGDLWLGLANTGATRVRWNGVNDSNPQIDTYGDASGLPLPGYVFADMIEDRVLFATDDGLYRFIEDSGSFELDPDLNVIATDSGSRVEGFWAIEDAEGRVWVTAGEHVAVITRGLEGGAFVDRVPVLQIADEPGATVFPDLNGVVWLGLNTGLLRYDTSINAERGSDYRALIRRVIVDGDSLIYAGSAGAAEAETARLGYADNALRFEFAAPTFVRPMETEFQSMLEGFNSEWSAWSTENRRDYTNLPFGQYRFRIRARNVFQEMSTEADYTFAISPPWYRTWWAYAAYLLVFVAGVFGTDRLQRRRLLRKEQERARLREAELRAEAAEAQAATAEAERRTAEAQSKAFEAENQRKRNVELLSEIGKEITATLDFDTIFHRLYEHVNGLADATVFGVGIYHPEEEEIEYRLAIEKGSKYEPYTRDATDRSQFPVWCIENRKPVFINDVATEYGKYIDDYKDPRRLLEDGSYSEGAQSMIYLPLISKDRVLGVITIQSYDRNAYEEHHLNILQSLATYTSIALDNADAYRRLNSTLEDLQAAQTRLVQSEKMASLGQLTAGIAHEIKNPLNFVNNFAAVSSELTDELLEEIEANMDKNLSDVADELRQILADLKINADLISEHGTRADGIVKSMLQHSRGDEGERSWADVNLLLEEYVNLAYHGMRAADADFNSSIERDYDDAAGKVEMVPQDIGRVLINLLNNAFYAVNQRAKDEGDDFRPTVSVHTRRRGDRVEIGVRDNGTGIPETVRQKIFEPFFTTKPTGSGTGLGLSMSYDIITQGHGGELTVDTRSGEYTLFVIALPV